MQISSSCKLGFGTMVFVLYDYKNTKIKKAEKNKNNAKKIFYAETKVKN